MLEQLHFHTSDDSAFINQLNKDLAEAGLIDPHLIEKKISIKPEFRQTSMFQEKVFYKNERKLQEQELVHSDFIRQ